LRDVCEDYDDNAWVLVANAAQVLFESLAELVNRLAQAGGEVNIVNDSDGIPNGLILLRCGVLRSISQVGFHDMKEQVIPSLARRHLTRVISSHGLTSRPIHSLKDYTNTLRRYYGEQKYHRPDREIYGERWQSRFSILEQGAVVAPSAVIHDAVVLQGAVVEQGAVVVRSVVGQGARVRSGQTVFDEVFVS
jgi:NDP-sugar pyrophosphorylase family protein